MTFDSLAEVACRGFPVKLISLKKVAMQTSFKGMESYTSPPWGQNINVILFWTNAWKSYGFSSIYIYSMIYYMIWVHEYLYFGLQFNAADLLLTNIHFLQFFQSFFSASMIFFLKCIWSHHSFGYNPPLVFPLFLEWSPQNWEHHLQGSMIWPWPVLPASCLGFHSLFFISCHLSHFFSRFGQYYVCQELGSLFVFIFTSF